MSFVALFLTILGKKINLSNRLIIKESLNQNDFGGVVKLVINIFKYTFIIEVIGAILLGFSFIPEYGISKGIFYSIFHSISAFCNAGFDVLGNNSLMNFAEDKIVNITIMLLIIIGGLGFTVWNDIVDSFIKNIKNKFSLKRFWRGFCLHTKLVLCITAILLITGTVFICALEWNNKNTLYNESISDKILISSFQSTTLRTAGFSTLDFNELTTAGKFISICYMIVGGSPASTAGGVKTVTLGVIALSVIGFIKGKNEIQVFRRSISQDLIRRASIIISITLFVIILATMSLLITESTAIEEMYTSNIANLITFKFIDVVFEVVSAFATVGLTLNVTTNLSIIGKFIVMFLMLIGRVGPVTMSLALFKRNSKKDKTSAAVYPKEDLLIG